MFLETICKLPLVFRSLLTAAIVKNNNTWTRILFIFLKIILKQTWKDFNTKCRPQWKDHKSSCKFIPGWKHQKSSYQVRQILAFFGHLIPQILGENSVKGIGVTRIPKESKSEEIWVELEANICFQRQSFRKHFRLALVFMQITHYGESLIFIFNSFLLVLTKFSFWQGDWAICYHFMEFWEFSGFI